MMTLDSYLLAYKEGKLSEAELREQIKKVREASPRTLLSEGQKGLWVEHARSLSANYNIQMGFVIKQKISLESLQKAFEFLLAQHPILRSIIEEVEGVPYQRIDESSTVGFWHEDWTGRQMDEALSYLNEKARQPFSLSKGPLIRMHVLSLSPDEHIALIVVHHIVFDGASWPVLMSTLLEAYDAFANGKDLIPTPGQSSYRDFVWWEQMMLRSKEADDHSAYWENQLRGPLPVLELPSDRPRSLTPVVDSRTYVHVLEVDLSNRIKEWCRAEGRSVATYFQALFRLLLHRYTNERDVILGMPTMGRPQAHFEELIGYFVNMIAVRTQINPEQSFSDLVRDVHVAVVDGIDHAAYPFSRVVQDLNVPRQHAPIFQVGYSFQNASLFSGYGLTDESYPGLRIALLDGINREGPFGEYELALEVRELDEIFDLAIKYHGGLFDESTIARLMNHYLQLLKGVLANPDLPLHSYSLLSPEETDQVLVQWNSTAAEFPENVCVQELFEEQVKKTPQALAVIYENQQLTYAELNRKANQLARYLRTQGVGPDQLVAVCLERSLEMVIGILGIIKAGGAYVPLDPSYPSERLEYMLNNSAPRLILTQERLKSTLPATAAQMIALDTQWSEVAEYEDTDIDPGTLGLSPQNLVYVVYTSGSTGQPKGIQMPHRAMVNLVHWHPTYFAESQAGRTLHFAALGFDVAFQEVFVTLCFGGTLLLINQMDRLDPQFLTKLIQAKNVQRIIMPFSALQNVVTSINAANMSLPHLKDVVSSGEQLRITPAISEFFKRHPSCQFQNHYGPAETHVVTSWSLAVNPDEWNDFPPIGRPVANSQIYILDGYKQPVPIGIPGEIYIGGVQVSRGYLNRPELTAERYIEDPFSKENGARLYKTGDVGRFRTDGAIEFLGRNDDQVKIRGFRIELGEVEANLRQHTRVREAVVIAREDVPGDKRLVAYLTQTDEAPLSVEDLRTHLKLALPEYMVPSAFVTLTTLPISPNGKLHRKALPAPGLDAYSVTNYVSPQGEVEQTLARIWQKLLRVERVGRNDNFFDLGGHSLLAMQVIARMREDLGMELSPNVLFDNQTIARLAEYIGALAEVRQLAGRPQASGSSRQRGVL